MDNSISLYIHIPFCKQKCLYCDFPSFCGKDNMMLSYAEALSKEIDNIKDKVIKTIFIGGGTPTYLSLEAWHIIKKTIDNLCKSKDMEFTVEANPGTLDKEKLMLLKKMGVNRISLGLQAWQNEHLKNLGRIHSAQEFLESYNLARSLGFNNINVDLMFGLPDESLDQWKETLKQVIDLKPEHLSCYSLIIEEGTPLYNLYEAGKINLPEEDTERKMYWYTLSFLKSEGYDQYEISNFSKKNFQSQHNRVYWEHENYIGCGAAAHSFYKGYRYKNESDIGQYIKLINDKKSAVIEKRLNTLEENMEEFIFMGLRLIEGISIDKFNNKFNISIFNIYEDAINKHKNNGLLKEQNGYLCLTPKGIEISNEVMSDFILS